MDELLVLLMGVVDVMSQGVKDLCLVKKQIEFFEELGFLEDVVIQVEEFESSIDEWISLIL